jgi:hypothetical protein
VGETGEQEHAVTNLPPYINPADPPSWIDPNNPLTAKTVYTLETGTIVPPGGRQMAVWTIRSPDATLIVMLTAEEHAMWVEAVSAVKLSSSGLQVTQNPRIVRSGLDGKPPETG